MSDKQKKDSEEEKKDRKKWTLMFFFASDNNLSASMFYQLKAIKTAGFQVDTNVLAHFDPHQRGIPSMIFEINRMERKDKTESEIGDEENPVIRDLAGDQVQPYIPSDPCIHTASSEFDDLPAEEALEKFLDFCREHYPAEHYMLFLVGHGMIVGRDAFLPDENPNSGISLVELGSILRNFSDEISVEDETLELVAMHSCSMSAVEVAYQLKGTANYMIASEGLSFVGAWPYRQMLQKVFCAIEYGPVKVENLMKVIHETCLHNGADFIFAGYSSDLCLIKLASKNVEALNDPIEKLTKALQQGLKDKWDMDLIVLAHWKSQSYFQETYTDLLDFCECLREKCEKKETPAQRAMSSACDEVIKVLRGGTRGPIVRADFSGPDIQYSHGLSIYFPWARPVEDAQEHVIKNYRNYAFVTELGGASWLQFLNAYFKETRRDPVPTRDSLPLTEQKTWDFAAAAFKPVACHNGPIAVPAAALTGKDSPADAGGDFTYSIIKNYPREFAISRRALKVFADEKGRKKN
ncbi:MAG TPA: clostripain-related cysteine peptidase [Pyrinomonadaceae bacterium]|nr:clostripain-related cysteine peptidase [Pyrinomonadaceae bacterium]